MSEYNREYAEDIQMEQESAAYQEGYSDGYCDGYEEGYRDGESSLSHSQQYEDGYNEAKEKYIVYYDLLRRLLKFVSQRQDVLDAFTDTTDLTDSELSLLESFIK